MTDQDYRILALLRVVETADTKMAVGETYNMKLAVLDFPKLDVDKLRDVLRNAGPKDTLKKVLNTAYGKHHLKKIIDLFYINMIASEYGPAMIEHIILTANLNPNLKVATEMDSSEGK